MKRVLVLLLTSVVGALLVVRRRKARDGSDLWAEATRALQAPQQTSAPGAGGGSSGGNAQ